MFKPPNWNDPAVGIDGLLAVAVSDTLSLSLENMPPGFGGLVAFVDGTAFWNMLRLGVAAGVCVESADGIPNIPVDGAAGFAAEFPKLNPPIAAVVDAGLSVLSNENPLEGAVVVGAAENVDEPKLNPTPLD